MFLRLYELMQFVFIVSISMKWLFHSGAILNSNQELRMDVGNKLLARVIKVTITGKL